MNNKEILRRALAKAELNGFKLKDGKHFLTIDNKTDEIADCYSILFCHDFAKTFWGVQEHEYVAHRSSGCDHCKFCSAYTDEYEESVGNYCWQQNLSDMVLSEEPLKYLEKFL